MGTNILLSLQSYMHGYSTFGIIVVILLIFPLYSTLIFIGHLVKLRKFKGPMALPLVGNCYNSEALSVLRYLGKLRKRYGRVFTFFTFMKPYVVICEPVAVRRILSDPKTFIKGEDYSTVFNIAFGEGLVTSNGNKHKRDRGLFHKYFIKTNIAPFLVHANTITKEAIEEEIIKNGNERKSYDIEEFFAILALRTFMKFFCGKKFTKKEEEYFTKFASEGSYIVGRMIMLGFPIWSPVMIPWVTKIKEGKKRFWSSMKDVINERKSQIKLDGEPEIDDCLSVLINSENNMTEEDMSDHIITMLCAGHDTTAYFSSYTAHLLAQYPEIQEKLRTEIQEVLQNKTEISADDISKMIYLNKVMQESLRLYSIIPCVSRQSVDDIVIKEADNLSIPKGANILIPMFLINRDPELWINPSVFDPERFDGKTDWTSAKHGFFPFGYGTRVCIGNSLAQLESGIFLCHLLLKYKIEQVKDWKPNIFSGISLTTNNGIRVILTPL